MALIQTLLLNPNPPNNFPSSISLPRLSSSQYRKKPPQLSLQSNRRLVATILFITTTISTRETILSKEITANAALDLRMTVPDQTVEEAESGIRGHAQSLIQVKEILERESWREAQKELRKCSSYLKQDIYTLIQSKPGIQRPLLRKLYSELFNSVTRLDYAARDKDVTRVWESYDHILVLLNDILSRILIA